MTDAFIEKIKTLGVIVRHKEQLPLGNKSRGKFVPQENGRRAILVPSFGALEKEEVDYTVEAAQEKEDERIRKEKPRQQKEELGQIVTAMMRTKPGKRAEMGHQIIRESGR